MDPGRDRVDDYVAMARRKGLTVTDILETHVHADHVSGNQALAAKTGARIHIHPAAQAAFAHDPVEHGRGDPDRQRGARGPPHARAHARQHRPAGDRSEPWRRALVRADRRHPLRRRRRAGRISAASGRGQPLREPHRAPAARCPTASRCIRRTAPDRAAAGPCRARPRRPSASSAASTPRSRCPTPRSFVRRLMTGLPPKPPNFDRIIARNRAQALPPGPASRGRSRRRRCGSCSTRAPACSTCAARRSTALAHVPGRAQRLDREPAVRQPRPGCSSPPRRRSCWWPAARPTSPARCRASAASGSTTIAGHLQWGMADWKSQGLPVGAGAADQRARSGHDEGGAARSGGRSTSASPSSGTRATSTGALHLPMAEAVRRHGPSCRRGGRRRSLCAGGLRSSLGDQRAEPRRA